MTANHQFAEAKQVGADVRKPIVKATWAALSLSPYKTEPLPAITQSVDVLSDKVAGHLRTMGLEWGVCRVDRRQRIHQSPIQANDP